MLILKDTLAKEILFWQFVRYETNDLYLKAICSLESDGFKIKAVVCDGKTGLLKSLPYPTQMCQFHQTKIITKYLTLNPKLTASQELADIVEKLTRIKKNKFRKLLNQWRLKWSDFLKEKSFSETTGRWFYTHKRLRSACRSLEKNFEHLFTFQEYPKLKIPNTTNCLEGSFTNLKTKVRLHSGMNLLHKMRFINQMIINENLKHLSSK